MPPSNISFPPHIQTFLDNSSQTIKFGNADSSTPTKTMESSPESSFNKEVTSPAKSILGMRDKGIAASIRRQATSPALNRYGKDVNSPSNSSPRKNEEIITKLKKRVNDLEKEVESRRETEASLHANIAHLNSELFRLDVARKSLEFGQNTALNNLQMVQTELARTVFGPDGGINFMATHQNHHAALINSVWLQNNADFHNTKFLHNLFSQTHEAFSSATAALEDLRTRHRDLIEEKSQLEADVETFARLGKKDVQEKDEKIEQLQTRISEISKYFESSQLTVEKMEGDIEVFGKEIDRLDTIISALSAGLESATHDRTALVPEYRNTIDALEKDLETLARLGKKYIQGKDKKIEHLDARISTVSADLESALQDGADLRASISEYKTTINDLKRNLEASVSSSKNDVQERDQKIERLGSKISELSAKLEQSEQALSLLQKENAEKIDKPTSDERKDEVTSQKATAESKDAEIKSLQDTISQLNEEKATLQKKVNFLAPKYKEKIEELDALDKRYKRLESRKKVVDTDYQVQKEAHENALSELQGSIFGMMMNFNSQAEELQFENEKLRAELEAAQKKLDQSSGPSPSGETTEDAPASIAS